MNDRKTTFLLLCAVVLVPTLTYLALDVPSPGLAEGSPTASLAIAPSAPQRSASTVLPSASLASNEATRPATPSISAQEIARVNAWGRARGHPNEAFPSQSGIAVRPAFTGYESSDDGTLRLLAAQGDQRAGLVLAQKLRARYTATVPPSAVSTEIVNLLLDATMRGYTVSLETLIDLKADQANKLGEERRRGRDPFDREALFDAYKYAYLLERRGDLSQGVFLETLRQTAPLSEQAIERARHAAATLHADMNKQRQALGLTPFEDGIPPDVLDIMARAQAPHGRTGLAK